MEENTKILLSAHGSNEIFIQHFGIIHDVINREGKDIRAEILARFQIYINQNDVKQQILYCRFMFIFPSKLGKEWVHWKDALHNTHSTYQPTASSFQTTIFYYKPDVGVKYKTF